MSAAPSLPCLQAPCSSLLGPPLSHLKRSSLTARTTSHSLEIWQPAQGLTYNQRSLKVGWRTEWLSGEETEAERLSHVYKMTQLVGTKRRWAARLRLLAKFLPQLHFTVLRPTLQYSQSSPSWISQCFVNPQVEFKFQHFKLNFAKHSMTTNSEDHRQLGCRPLPSSTTRNA